MASSSPISSELSEAGGPMLADIRADKKLTATMVTKKDLQNLTASLHESIAKADGGDGAQHPPGGP
ncbi:Hypothetical predicted protein [Pelobates cultripes]|uniref:Uncharacterized protein n=1 Tax=Pelobates cultripes TaxID=61616 RepID=A0AAD1VT46_PELCU|nr:Hypothetical predicted protein [Pelobates cultripes]